MADVSITAANVKVGGSTTKWKQVTYGASVTQGQPVYPDAADGNEYKPADADAANTAAAEGIAITPGGDGDIGIIAVEGPVAIGGTLVVGQTYAVSTNPGGIAPLSDLGSGDFPRVLGQALTSSVLDVKPYGGTVAKA